MFVNYRIRTILGDIISKRPVRNRLRLVNNECKGDESSRLTQVIALNSNEADRIVDKLQRYKDELGLRSIKKVASIFEYRLHRNEPPYSHSVLLQVDPFMLFKSALRVTKQAGIEHLRRQVVFPYDPDIDLKKPTSKRIVVDFSSPNIAKPFHYGHLRSTILGNFLANLYDLLGHQVTRLNFIGDWGTQYGLLSLALDRSEELAKASPDFELVTDDDLTNTEDPNKTLRKLLKVYELANKLGEEDPKFYSQARKTFKMIEQDARYRDRWLQIRSLSLKELQRSYQDLGISFDVYDFESDYANSIDFVQFLSEMGLLVRDEEGLSKVALRKTRVYEAPILRSDGTSLYLTRDVAAAFARKEKYKFDEMLYVAGVDQERHFHSLREIIKLLGHAELAHSLTHIKVGKVLGFSSRTGNGELLSDIIEKAKQKFVAVTRGTPTSKYRDETDAAVVDKVGHNLALSSLFVSDLRFSRKHHYEFGWEYVTRTGSNSGVNLQATYARLCSLRSKALAHFDMDQEQLDRLVEDDSELSIEAVDNLFAMDLVGVLNDFDVAVHDCHSSMDASSLVWHAISLCRHVNRARQASSMQILREPDRRLALTRLALFMSAREQLGLIIRLLGLVPLERV